MMWRTMTVRCWFWVAAILSRWGDIGAVYCLATGPLPRVSSVQSQPGVWPVNTSVVLFFVSKEMNSFCFRHARCSDREWSMTNQDTSFLTELPHEK